MNEVQLMQRRISVAEMYLRGHTRDRIALELGVAQGTVSSDLEAVRELWAEPLRERLEGIKAEELAKLRLLETVAWADIAAGNLRSMGTVLNCIRTRCQMLGLYNPEKVQVTSSAAVDWAALMGPAEDPIERRLAEVNGDD